jgi:hypothetical protein
MRVGPCCGGTCCLMNDNDDVNEGVRKDEGNEYEERDEPGEDAPGQPVVPPRDDPDPDDVPPGTQPGADE